MGDRKFELGELLKHSRILTRDLIAPTIYRLAERRKDWKEGKRDIKVAFRESVKGQRHDLVVHVEWSLASIALDHKYPTVREDLRKLADSKNDDVITELGALGTGFLLVTVLLPKDRITRVVQKGGRGDFYLNGRRDEMIEVSGTYKGDLNKRFSQKKAQILLNKSLRKAIVNVSRFEMPASRLERVK